MVGYLLGENWHSVEAYADVFQKLVIVACAAAVGSFVVFRLARRRRTKQALEPRPDGRGTIYGSRRR
jgi:membrane protein DedA with SNARE-associated domain